MQQTDECMSQEANELQVINYEKACKQLQLTFRHASDNP